MPYTVEELQTVEFYQEFVSRLRTEYIAHMEALSERDFRKEGVLYSFEDILTGLGPKQDKCSQLLERRNNGTITQSAYEAASKDCGKEEVNFSEEAEVPNEEIDTEEYKDNNFVGDYLQEQRDEAFNNNPYYTGQTPYRGLDQYN